MLMFSVNIACPYYVVLKKSGNLLRCLFFYTTNVYYSPFCINKNTPIYLFNCDTVKFMVKIELKKHIDVTTNVSTLHSSFTIL